LRSSRSFCPRSCFSERRYRSGQRCASVPLSRPRSASYGMTGAFPAWKSNTCDTAILIILVTSGLSNLPPMKVVTILSGVVSFDLKWFILSAIIARGGRFYLLAFLLQRYGAKVALFIEHRLAMVMAGLVIVAGVGWVARWVRGGMVCLHAFCPLAAGGFVGGGTGGGE